MNTNNGKRLIAAVAILAMVLCAFAAIVPAADAVDDETYGGTYAADPVLKGEVSVLGGTAYVSLLNEDGSELGYTNGNTEAIYNSVLGNSNLKIVKDSDNEITISGTLALQGEDSQFKKTGSGEYDYGFLFNLTGPKGDDGDYGFGSEGNPVYISYQGINGWKTLTKTGSGSNQLVYVDTARTVTTYYITSNATYPTDEDAAKADTTNTKALTVNLDFTFAGTIDDASDLQGTLDGGADNVTVTGGTITADSNVSLDAGQTVTLGSDVKIESGATFTVPEEAVINYSIPSTAPVGSIKIVGGDIGSQSTVVLKNVTGTFTVTGGSVVLKDTVNSSMTIDLERVGGEANVEFLNATITSNSVITLGDGINYSVIGDIRLYGKILSTAPNGTSDETDDGIRTITVNDPNSFTAYAGATIGKGVVIDGNGDIDVSAAMSTVTLNDDIESDFNASQSQKVVIADTLTIKSGYTMNILGELVINENCTLIIEDGAYLIVGKTAVATGVTVNGIIEVEDGGTFNVASAQNVTVNGSIVSEGNIVINSNVTVKTGGVIDVVEADNSSIDVQKGLTIEAGGELSVSGKMKVSSIGISNKGTIILDNAKLEATDTNKDNWIYINMAGDNAVVDVRSVIALNDAILRIQDNGLVFEVDKQNNIVDSVKDDSESNAVRLEFKANDGIRNLSVTEKVTSEKDGDVTKYSNFMYISGNLAVESENSTPGKVSITLRGAGQEDGMMVVDEGSTLTVGKGISVGLSAGNLLVTGDVVSTADGASFGIASSDDQKTIDVTGMITVNQEITSNINAFHYTGGDENGYEYYTTLATAIANGATDIDFIGSTKVMENVTIPAGTRVSAANSSAVINIGSIENRDVTVTVADSGSIRDGKVVVEGTLVFENNKRDNRADAIESDVQIDEEPKMTYTNIYTALNNAESGKVTITRNTVTLNQDITVKEGVTLVIPANTTVEMWNKVTLTIDGTVENSGKIINVPGDGETVAGTFQPTVNNETNIDAAKIVVNGAFKSLEYTHYDDATDDVNYYIPGAYYQIIDTEGSWYWITPVENAATVAATVENGIEIFGNVTIGDVTFAGSTEEGAENVIITVTGNLTAGTVTLSNATLDINGQYDGVVATAVGTVDFANVKDIVISDTVDADDNEIMTLSGTPVQANSEIKSKKVTVSSGAVTINGALNVYGVTFSIAEGASVTVTGDNGKLESISGDKTGNLTVNGALVATDNGSVQVGTLTVNGTFTVEPANETEKTDAGKANVIDLFVGISYNSKAQGFIDATAASVSADTITGLGRIVVSADSTVSGKLIENKDNTEFYVEDALWITVYDFGNAGNIASVDGDKVTYGYVPTGLTESEFVGWNNADGKLITTEIEVGNPSYAKVYANINYNVYKVVITLDNTVGSVAIDGQMLVYNSELGGYVLPNNMLLTAGQHTVTYTLTANYEGTPTLSSQTVSVSGLTFTLSGDFKSDNNQTIQNYLSLGGATLADQTIVIEGGSTGGSDSLGLTDYLLIILVILIVIMAIMVAFRLMRS